MSQIFYKTLTNKEELQKLWNFDTYNDLILIIAMFNNYKLAHY